MPLVKKPGKPEKKRAAVKPPKYVVVPVAYSVERQARRKKR